MRAFIQVATLLVASTPALRAQGGPSVLEPRHFELGITQQWIRRTIRYTDGSREEAPWGRLAIFLRLALTNTIAADLNGLAWHRGSTDQFPTRDYFDFSFGAGLIFAPYRRGPTTITATAHFHDLAFLDQSDQRYSKRTRQLALSGLFTRTFPIFNQRSDVWLGPVYIVDWLVQYPPVNPTLRGRSLHDAGVVVGGSLIIARRFRLFGQWVYVAAWQSEGGLSILP
jgi:hypothetical protein